MEAEVAVVVEETSTDTAMEVTTMTLAVVEVVVEMDTLVEEVCIEVDTSLLVLQ